MAIAINIPSSRDALHKFMRLVYDLMRIYIQELYALGSNYVRLKNFLCIKFQQCSVEYVHAFQAIYKCKHIDNKITSYNPEQRTWTGKVNWH